MNAESMYGEMILDYYRNPRNYGSVQNPTATSRDFNPLCGDEVQISLKITDGKIEDVKFCGKGCAISQAAAGILTEIVKGKSVEEARTLTKDGLLATLGIPLSYARLKCGLLGLKVLKMAVYEYLGEILSREEFE